MSGERRAKPPVKFGTFTGVFTPTLLTILGVIMYVRLGWVVGNAGLLGAWAILVLAIGITVCTGLSLSSIATNTRLGAGGPYAMITRSLGLEVGGSIGVPLYLSRPLGIAMYIFGFREGWQWVFPEHDALLIDLAVFMALFALAYISANIAFQVQFLIMAVIVVSLAMIIMSPTTFAPESDISWWGEYPGFVESGFKGTNFWVVFAVFFPATTGILAGANMSGDLKDPRRAIPVGTLWAIVVSSVIYFALAYWLARTGSTEELVTNYTIAIDKAFWGPGVLAGLLGATFSSALAGCVGGPRILMAMADHRLLPKSEWLAKTSAGGEPRNAIMLTAILTLGCVMMRDLNAIAPLVTMFFLITYLMINVVLLVETRLALVSFRPTLTVPAVVPLIGAVGCVFCMFIVNPSFGLIAVGTSIAIYIWINKQGVDAPQEDVRSSVFVAMAEWAAAKVEALGGGSNVRAWKPNLLVPVEDTAELRGEANFLRDVCLPEGRVKLLGLTGEGKQQALQPQVEAMVQSFREQQLYCSWSIVGSPSFRHGVMNGLEALQGAFFRPNVLFMALPDDAQRDDEFGEIIVDARRTGVGVLMLGMHPRAAFGQRKAINLYVRPSHTGWSVDDAFEHNNLDLVLLIGYRLMHAWDAKLTLITVVPDESEVENGDAFLYELSELARFPLTTKRLTMVGKFAECAAKAPQSDLDLMGLQSAPDFSWMRQMIDVTRSSCLFVTDSGRESARA
jgi:amino acid transporter